MLIRTLPRRPLGQRRRSGANRDLTRVSDSDDVRITQQRGYRWLPLGLEYALTSWRVVQQAGRTPLILGALCNAPLSFVRLPKLDVVGSSPIARSVNA